MSCFEADYPGVCAICEERFGVGTEVRFDQRNQIRHARQCPEPRPVGKVCTGCFTELPLTGECDNCG